MGPPDLAAAFIPASGETLLGGLYQASAERPRPAALLLHGLPGHEKNLDLAIDLRERGVHALYFHYRGSWGSSGTFSIAGLLADASAALAYLADRPEVDPRRLAVIGFSLGGWAALALAASDPRVAACVAVAPLVDPRDVPLPADLADESAATLAGTSAARLRDEWISLPAALSFAEGLRRVPLLLVTADHDELFPPAHYRDLPANLPQMSWVRFPRARHLFGGVRPGLRHTITDWLSQRLD